MGRHQQAGGTGWRARAHLGEAPTDERGQFGVVLWPVKFYLKARPFRSPGLEVNSRG
jgi:hypothetical protein